MDLGRGGAGVLRALRADERAAPGGRTPTVGQLLDDVPGFLFLMAGAALGGQVVVGLNPTRRGAALAADVARADVQVVVADPTYAALLGDVDVAVLKRELAAVGPVAGDGTLWARAPRGTSYLPA